MRRCNSGSPPRREVRGFAPRAFDLRGIRRPTGGWDDAGRRRGFPCDRPSKGTHRAHPTSWHGGRTEVRAKGPALTEVRSVTRGGGAPAAGTPPLIPIRAFRRMPRNVSGRGPGRDFRPRCEVSRVRQAVRDAHPSGRFVTPHSPWDTPLALARAMWLWFWAPGDLGGTGLVAGCVGGTERRSLSSSSAPCSRS